MQLRTFITFIQTHYDSDHQNYRDISPFLWSVVKNYKENRVTNNILKSLYQHCQNIPKKLLSDEDFIQFFVENINYDLLFLCGIHDLPKKFEISKKNNAQLLADVKNVIFKTNARFQEISASIDYLNTYYKLFYLENNCNIDDPNFKNLLQDIIYDYHQDIARKGWPTVDESQIRTALINERYNILLVSRLEKPIAQEVNLSVAPTLPTPISSTFKSQPKKKSYFNCFK